jgi:hypothetical protein
MAEALLDDPWFRAELDKLDGPPARRAVRATAAARFLAPDPPERPRPTFEQWAGEASERGLPLLPAPPGPHAAPDCVLTPLAFMSLMAAGAALAAVVFHDRVALILATF